MAVRLSLLLKIYALRAVFLSGHTMRWDDNEISSTYARKLFYHDQSLRSCLN